jgi:hypothetical protein
MQDIDKWVGKWCALLMAFNYVVVFGEWRCVFIVYVVMEMQLYFQDNVDRLVHLILQPPKEYF